MAIFALRGPIAARVAVQASWAFKNRCDALKGGQCLAMCGEGLPPLLAERGIGQKKCTNNCQQHRSRQHGSKHIVVSLTMLSWRQIGE
jgi:hypothetical protein